MIPKRIVQTHKNIQTVMEDKELRKAHESWKRFDKEFRYVFYDDEKQDLFMKNHFPNIYDMYKNLPLPVMKADLFRYCEIYVNGGIYADADAILIGSPYDFLIDKALLVIAPENDDHLCQWTFAAPPKSPILKSIIDTSVNKIKEVNEDYKSLGQHFVHMTTGPGVFTKGIETYLMNNDLPVYNKKGQRKKYENYELDDLYVFEHNRFHKKLIKHIFTGQKPDGWLKQKKKKMGL